MDELLDLRRDLAAPLTRYRAVVSRMSQGLTNSLGDDAQQEIDDLMETEVRPALLDVEELLAQHGLVRELARSAGRDNGRYIAGTSALYLGIGAVTDVRQKMSAALASAPGAAQIVHNAVLGRAAAQNEARSKDLFYLHEIRTRIA